MARMGGSRHLKALSAPSVQRIPRKVRPWTVKPSPGPHPADRSLPLLIVIRDLLKYAETAREATKIISSGQVKVDGKVVRDYKFPIGVMDIVELPSLNLYYRVVPDPTGTLRLVPISKEEASLKLLRIEGVTTLKGGHFQVHLSDGRNVLVRVEDSRKPGQLPYKPLDSLVLNVPEGTVKDHIEFKEGSLALVVWGRNMGKLGKIVSVTRGWGWDRSVASLQDSAGNSFETSLSNIYVVGRDKPVVTVTQG
ncbi:30S ribosomal protein S4e [Acidilobus saccharovorans 345-15]|uniref:Small ribosomal subunit protein eS4 n=1 Tax=Acidilobus saccharovorans (strain DSM 16705 / JCM 18335 / VKM B-2471 / 345-15) TaxID=666510 RepID=D9PZZ5_ACIS3|nr:30S ribosomal protein S4e [Acidilobus saccharovorans]ADL18633.1 30S ribosomal protein S4e [Acidilobus saccharovorans 345-15]